MQSLKTLPVGAALLAIAGMMGAANAQQSGPPQDQRGAWAHGSPMWWSGPNGMGRWMGGWWMPLHGILSLVVFVLAVVGVVALVRSLFGSDGRVMRGGGRLPGLDVLQERFAKGEIQRDEYLQKKRDLGG